MSRRHAVTMSLISAAIAAAITAAAVLALDRSVEPAPTHSTADIRSEQPPPSLQTPRPRTPAAPQSFAESTAATVDWAAIYEQTVPALVSVVADGSAGSGFFVSQDGHVITNFHVVSGGGSLRVFTQQGNMLDAELIAKDVGNDLALLKVDPKGIEITVPLFADLEETRVGDPVGALGAPFSLPNTLTVGIVSALGRERQNGAQAWEPIRGMIQTDAALNPGNSGGMLIDGRGRVVGIPTQIESNDRTSSGIGFAVSVQTLLRSLPTMLEGRDVERTFLGVTVDGSDGRLKIQDVFCGSSADRADLKAGDTLLSVNDHSTETLDDLVDVLASITPGERITIKVQRGLRRIEVAATAKAWPTNPLRRGCG